MRHGAARGIRHDRFPGQARFSGGHASRDVGGDLHPFFSQFIELVPGQSQAAIVLREDEQKARVQRELRSEYLVDFGERRCEVSVALIGALVPCLWGDGSCRSFRAIASAFDTEDFSDNRLGSGHAENYCSSFPNFVSLVLKKLTRQLYATIRI